MVTLRMVSKSWPALLMFVFFCLRTATFQAQESNSNQIRTDRRFADLQRAAAAEANAGNNAEAISDLRRALEMQPGWKEGWWNLGTLLYQTNQYNEAAQAFRKVVEFVPGMGTAWALLGLCEFEIKDYAAASSHLKKAKSLGFGDDSEIVRVSSYHLALLLIRAGDFEHSMDLLNSAFSQGALTPQVKLAFGLALLRVPLLPDELDPSKDALVRAAGDLAPSGADAATLFPKFIQNYPATPYVHYTYGVRFKEAGRLNQALVQQREEAKLSPQSALPWIEISALQLTLQNQDEALSAAEKAVALEPGMPAAHRALANALQAQGKSTRAKKEQERLQSLVQGAKVRDPRMISLYGNPDAAIVLGAKGAGTEDDRWRQAMMDYSAGRYAEAIAGLKPWLKTNAAIGTAWAVLGLSEFALKDYENSRIHLERGEQLGLSGGADSIRLAKYTLGILLVQSGEFDRASELLASAAGLGDLQGQVRLASGLAMLRIPKLPGDVEASQRELAERAGDIAQWIHESKYDKADAAFEALLKQYPAIPFLHYAYGTALLALSQYDEAAAQMRSESAISPKSELPFLRLASIALRKQSPSEAIAPAEQAVLLAGGSAEAHYLLGRSALLVGDHSKSVRELEIACRIAPGSPEAHFNLAKAYAKVGQPKRAAEERATFIELNAVAEEQRSHSGNQAYQGPHEAGEMSVPQNSAADPTSPN